MADHGRCQCRFDTITESCGVKDYDKLDVNERQPFVGTSMLPLTSPRRTFARNVQVIFSVVALKMVTYNAKYKISLSIDQTLIILKDMRRSIQSFSVVFAVYLK